MFLNHVWPPDPSHTVEAAACQRRVKQSLRGLVRLRRIQICLRQINPPEADKYRTAHHLKKSKG